MPRKNDAVVIGRLNCKCGARAAVLQDKNRFFYTRCECGCDQRRKMERQVFVWQHLEPVQGAVIVRPDNVPETAGEMGCAMRGEAPAVVVVDPLKTAAGDTANPGGDTLPAAVGTDQQTPPETREKPRGGGLLLALLLLALAAMGGAIWWLMKAPAQDAEGATA